MNWRKLISKIHLWLGLISGFVVFIVGLTGTIFVFSEEIMDYANRDVLSVPKNNHSSKKRLNVDEQIASFNKAFSDEQVFVFTTFRDTTRSTQIVSMSKAGLQTTYLNPYSGEIMKVSKIIMVFFVDIILHRTLFLGDKIGPTVIGISTLVFLLQLIGGLYLWWPPKNKKARKSAFTIKWNARAEKRNYDLHNVLGFYATPYSLIIAVTGLVIVFQPVKKVVYNLFGGNISTRIESFAPAYQENQVVEYDSAVHEAYQKNPSAQTVKFNLPADTVAYYQLTVARRAGLFSNDGKTIYMNKYTGKELQVPHSLNQNSRIDRANIVLHMGFWGGIWSKILVFCVGLVATSLPISGFFIWWGRKKSARMNNQ